MRFVEALKIWNKGQDAYCIPKSGTPEYYEVLKIMDNLPADVGRGYKKNVKKKKPAVKPVVKKPAVKPADKKPVVKPPRKPRAKKNAVVEVIEPVKKTRKTRAKKTTGKGMTRLGGCMSCSLTTTQEDKVHKLGMGLRRLGYSYSKPQRGGFFPALLAMLPALSSVAGTAGSALAGAAAGKLVDGIVNVAEGKNFFTGKGYGMDNCYCHHLDNNRHFNKCQMCAGVRGGNIMDIVPFFMKQVDKLSKNPFVKEAVKYAQQKLTGNGMKRLGGAYTAEEEEMLRKYQEYLKKKNLI
jgi:hypothetical protein